MTEPQPYASIAAVAGLAREVESLRRTVEDLLVLPARLDEVAGIVVRLAESVAVARPEPEAGTASWLGLADDAGPDDAESLLRGLIRWLEVVYLRYADGARGLPGCWLWHPEVVEELLWLRQAWAFAYEAGSPVSLAGDWHDRLRPGVVRRVREAAGMCSVENHQPGYDRHAAAPRVALVGAVGAVAEWWATARDDAPPAPTAEQLTAAVPGRRARG
jgi:hypothetical protein